MHSYIENFLWEIQIFSYQQSSAPWDFDMLTFIKSNNKKMYMNKTTFHIVPTDLPKN